MAKKKKVKKVLKLNLPAGSATPAPPVGPILGQAGINMMDFIKQYRPMTNVVHRPTLEGGKGYNLVGHHEIMFPLLAAAVKEELNRIAINQRPGAG